MPKLPRPPDVAVLRDGEPALVQLPAGTVLARVYFTGGAHPASWSTFRHYGPLNGRFDHHLPDKSGEPREQDRAVLYCAREALTCFAEVFQHTRRIDRVRAAPWLAVFELERKVSLLDLSGSYPTRAGASMAINTGSRARAREWAQRFYESHADLHGIHDASSMHANRSAVVLDDRAEAHGALPAHPLFNRALADDAMLDVLKHAAAALGYGLR
jgi:RES domain